VILAGCLLAQFAPAFFFLADHPDDSQLSGELNQSLCHKRAMLYCSVSYFQNRQAERDAEKGAQANNGGRNLGILVSDRPLFAARLTRVHREGKIPPPKSHSLEFALSFFFRFFMISFP
jgi:hypothetical protein